MSLTSQSLTEMATSIHVKDVLSFSFHTEYLHHNFNILKQCLIRLQDLEMNMGNQHDTLSAYSKRLKQVQEGLLQSNKKHDLNGQKISELQNNVGDQFMKRMYGIEEKTKNMFGFDETVNRLQALDLFLTIKSFKESQDKTQKEIDEVKKLKNQFERYLPNSRFDQFREREATIHAEYERKEADLQKQIKRLESEITKANASLAATNQQSQQNSKMLKQINFPEMLQKNKKFREDMDQRMSDLILKMKKKVGTNELVALEQTMIDKLDKFLSENQKSKAEKNQTKDALIFLQKRICDIQDFFTEKANQDDNKDALFSVKRVHCASCTKDLGKFQGKLGQFKPWSIFPCKQLDPEKTGGFGYMSYLDKIQVKKGSTLDDQAFDRLNKTTQEKDRQNSPKRGLSSSRPSNLISNYGSEEKGVASLKDVYFRELRTQKGERNSKFFRIKKQGSKPVDEFDKLKQ